MNKLYVGIDAKPELPRGGYIFIDDAVPVVRRAKVFDPALHSFNPLDELDHKKARDIAQLIYGLYPQGEQTLTVRNGKRALLRMLLAAKSLEGLKPQSEAEEEAAATVADMLISPVLRRVLCGGGRQFSLSPDSKVLVRLDRAQLGEFDAQALGHFLIGHYTGQVIVRDGGFYLRDRHVSLIRQGRLIAGVHVLSELPPKVRQLFLLEEKVSRGTTFEDAETLAKFARLEPGSRGFVDFVSEAIA